MTTLQSNNSIIDELALYVTAKTDISEEETFPDLVKVELIDGEKSYTLNVEDTIVNFDNPNKMVVSFHPEPNDCEVSLSELIASGSTETVITVSPKTGLDNPIFSADCFQFTNPSIKPALNNFKVVQAAGY